MESHNDESRDDCLTACLKGLCALYGKEFSNHLLSAYKIGLRDLSVEEIKCATATAMAECTFMPKPVELRKLRYGDVMSPQVRADIAWTELESAVVSVGGNYSVTFEDPFTAEAVRALGGWISVCNVPPREFDVFLRREFCRIYSGFVERGWVRQNRSNRFVGELELNNHTTDAPRNVAEYHIKTSLPVYPGQVRLEENGKHEPARIGSDQSAPCNPCTPCGTGEASNG